MEEVFTDNSWTCTELLTNRLSWVLSSGNAASFGLICAHSSKLIKRSK